MVRNLPCSLPAHAADFEHRGLPIGLAWFEIHVMRGFRTTQIPDRGVPPCSDGSVATASRDSVGPGTDPWRRSHVVTKTMRTPHFLPCCPTPTYALRGLTVL